MFKDEDILLKESNDKWVVSDSSGNSLSIEYIYDNPLSISKGYYKGIFTTTHGQQECRATEFTQLLNHFKDCPSCLKTVVFIKWERIPFVH